MEEAHALLPDGEPAAGFTMGVSEPPGDTPLEQVFSPMVAIYSGGTKHSVLCANLAMLDPPIKIVRDLKETLTRSELAAHVKTAGLTVDRTIANIGRILQPGAGLGFKWTTLAIGAKKRVGGNGSNKKVDVESGAPPIDYTTWRWPMVMFDGVPRKGEKVQCDNDDIGRLLDNTYCITQEIPSMRSYLPRGPAENLWLQAVEENCPPFVEKPKKKEGGVIRPVERLRVYYQNRRNKTGHLKRLVVAQQTADAYDSPVLAGGATWASSINVITSTADPGVAAAALARDQFMQTVKTELSNPAADLEAARAEGHVNPQVATHPAAVEEVAVIPPRAAEVAQPLEVVSAAHAAAIAQPLGVVSAVIQQATTAAAAAVLPTAATRSEPLPLPPKPTPPPPPLMPHGRQNTQVATTKAVSKKAGQAAKKREATEAMAAVDHAVDSSDEDSARQPPVGEASNPVPIIAKKKPKPNVPPPFTETTECKEHDLVVLPYDMTLFERGQPIAVFYPPKGNAELSTDDWYLGHVTKPLANKLQVRPIASRVSLSRSSHVMYACMHVCMYACMDGVEETESTLVPAWRWCRAAEGCVVRPWPWLEFCSPPNR